MNNEGAKQQKRREKNYSITGDNKSRPMQHFATSDDCDTAARDCPSGKCSMLN